MYPNMEVSGLLLEIVVWLFIFKGCKSSRKAMPGGGTQGKNLGLFLFLILIDAAGIAHFEKFPGQLITQELQERVLIPTTHMKYVVWYSNTKQMCKKRFALQRMFKI